MRDDSWCETWGGPHGIIFSKVKDLDNYFFSKLELVKLNQISWLGTCACMKIVHKQHTKKETKEKEGKEK